MSNFVKKRSCILDTRATHPFCRDKRLFTKYVSLFNDEMSIAIKDISFLIECKEEVKLHFGQQLFTLTNVMHSSQLHQNLLLALNWILMVFNIMAMKLHFSKMARQAHSQRGGQGGQCSTWKSFCLP